MTQMLLNLENDLIMLLAELNRLKNSSQELEEKQVYKRHADSTLAAIELVNDLRENNDVKLSIKCD